MIGRTLAHYEITAKLGEGGMGAVYLARDTKLGREVAVKLLPDHFAADPERLARFHREARTLAALNHPNIAAIFGLESDQGKNFLVMERADGEDLSVSAGQGPIPIDEALKIARQIALGLEEAHEKGIIHRDLKPANVKVSAEGMVKVLDFGLARALEGGTTGEESVMHSPTITAAMTAQGVILGTAAYMSPEQARGIAVDRRTDIWSFGVVLFEMLTGKRLFAGETVSDTLAGILKTDPDWDDLPDDTPEPVKLLLHRCLERDRRQRLQDIGEARILLSGDASGSYASVFSMTAAVGSSGFTGRPRSVAVAAAVAAGLVLGLAAGFFLLRGLRSESHPLPLRTLEIAMPAGGEQSARDPVISPDGTKAVFIIGNDIWLRHLDSGALQKLAGTQEASRPFWSPDSKEIGYFAKNRTMRMALNGGASVMVCDHENGTRGTGGTWTEDGRILFSLGDAQGILQVSALGGVPTTYAAPDSSLEQDLHDPWMIPGDRGLLFSAHLKDGVYSRLYLVRGGERILIHDSGDLRLSHPCWSAPGHVLFQLDGPNPGIWAVPFDLDAGLVSGTPFLVRSQGLWPSLSRDGALLCSTGSSSRNWQLVRSDLSGNILETHGDPLEYDPFFDVDAGGERAVISVSEDGKDMLWVQDLVRGTRTRLTFDEKDYLNPIWSPDGESVLASAGTGNLNTFSITRISVDGTAPQETFTRGLFPQVFPGGNIMGFTSLAADEDWDIATSDLGDPGRAPVLLGEPGLQSFHSVSPQGRHVAYMTREGSVEDIFLRRYPEWDMKRQVSVGGGAWPQWNRAGDRIYYMKELDLMVVDVQTTPSLRLGSPRKIFTRPPAADPIGFGWPSYFRISADEQSVFLLLQSNPGRQDQPLTYIQNWLAAFEPAS